MNNNTNPTLSAVPTLEYVWEDRGMDYAYILMDDQGNVLEELAYVKNQQGSNWYDLYVDGEWLVESVWSSGCKEFAEEFFDWLIG